jgi:hypothetical protein
VRQEIMDHLLKDSTTLELYAWLDDDAELPGWDILVGNPFGRSLPEDQFTTVQNYFAEYHLEYFRQRLYRQFPSRLHALLLFATRIDAETFRHKHPTRVLWQGAGARAQQGGLRLLVPRRELARLLATAAQPQPGRLSTRSPTTTGAAPWSKKSA